MVGDIQKEPSVMKGSFFLGSGFLAEESMRELILVKCGDQVIGALECHGAIPIPYTPIPYSLSLLKSPNMASLEFI